MHDGIEVGRGRRPGGNTGVDHERAVGKVRQIVVQQERRAVEVLTQHVPARVADRSQLVLVIEIVLAGGGVHKISERDGGPGSHRGLRGVFFRQEVTAHLAVGVDIANEVSHGPVVGHREADGAVAIEAQLARIAHHGNGGQVVDSLAVKYLVDAVSAVAIEAHIGRVRETHLAQLGIGQLIHSCLGNRYFHPLASGQFGLGCITVQGKRSCMAR